VKLATAVRELFPTPLWTIDLEPERAIPFNAQLQLEIDRLLSPRPPIPTGANWQTDPILHTLPQFAEFTALVEKVAAGLVDFLKLTTRDPVVTGCWANVNPPGGLNSAHTHPNNFLSGVYYVATPPGEGRIVFEDPRPQASTLLPPVTEYTKFTGNKVTVEAKPGRMVLFPAWLVHSVPVNRSKDDRISIAFNVMFKSYVEAASPPRWKGTVPLRG
jgi:uncharacterized protein (TIGR02466 family)